MKVVNGYLKKSKQSAQSELVEFLAHADAEALHQVRVHLKKIRAVYRMLKTVGLPPKLNKHYKKRMKPFFDDAGYIRRLQLHNEWLLRNNFKRIVHASVSFKKMPVLFGLFHEQAAEFSVFLSFFTKALISVSRSLQQKNLFRYAAALFGMIHEQLVSASASEWHSLRKLIKQLLCTYHWLDKKHQLRLMNVGQLAAFDALQEVTGKWHDIEDLRQWLTDEGFSMSSDALVKKEFSRAWELSGRHQAYYMKKVQSLIGQLVTEKHKTLL